MRVINLTYLNFRTLQWTPMQPNMAALAFLIYSSSSMQSTSSRIHLKAANPTSHCKICQSFHKAAPTIPFSIPSEGSKNSANDFCFGGGQAHLELPYHQLQPYALFSHDPPADVNSNYSFAQHLSVESAAELIQKEPGCVVCNLPLSDICHLLNLTQAKCIAQSHRIPIPIARASLSYLQNAIRDHKCCKLCYRRVFVFQKGPDKAAPLPAAAAYPVTETEFRAKGGRNLANKKSYLNPQPEPLKQNPSIDSQKQNRSRPSELYAAPHSELDPQPVFPPAPPSKDLLETVIRNFCSATSPKQFVEAGCAVCGQLHNLTDMILLSEANVDLSPLTVSGVTRKERMHVEEEIQELKEPVLDGDCQHICSGCLSYLKKRKIPPFSLANGLWLGKIPKELQDLSYVEKMLIAKVRHNRCIIRIKSSGRYKMRANAIVFQNPVPKIYNVLPPARTDMDQVLACMFTGPCKPTEQDLERTPILVRRNKIANALNWLTLNHSDYHDVIISQDNLDQYPEEGISVTIDSRISILNKEKEETSVHDTEGDDGIEDGDCPFVVHGLSGDEYATMTTDALKAVALEHLTSNNKILFVGHSQDPLSIYKNPQLFPSMMPWLFPFGLGGIKNPNHNRNTSTLEYKKRLLMYHDKRFQKDENFPLIAWNHEQISSATTAAFLTTHKANFQEIVQRLHGLDMNLLQSLIDRLKAGHRVKPETEMEKSCYKLLQDIDVAASHVQGSAGSKKAMRNEIWSLISYIGMPTWFITFSPVDAKHPICLYLADDKIEFKPEIRDDSEAFRLIAHNPVAAARFFHFIVQTFIKEVLGVETDHPGIYGDTQAYYGTVEQQGRLTLHLHTLVWIKNALSPQDIREKIMDPNSDFQEKLVAYLEGVHQGQCLSGTATEVKNRVDQQKKSDPSYKDPTKTMPVPPPLPCEVRCNRCSECTNLEKWWNEYEKTVDDLLIRSNQHTCVRIKEDHDENKEVRKACLNKDDECKARFPRDVVETTLVDPDTGALKMKHGEAYMNTFTPPLTYLVRCNTDATSLLSGTAVKAVVAYVCDYVSKVGLSAYASFDTIRQVLEKNSELINGTVDSQTSTRMLMTKMINALGAKMEMGSPMAAMYLLGNPDHYTSHTFTDVYWRNYVREARSIWETSSEEPDTTDKVVLVSSGGRLIGVSKVNDYVYRPDALSDMTLYDWIRLCQKTKRSRKEQNKFETQHTNDSEDESDDNMMSENDNDSDSDTLCSENDNESPYNILTGTTVVGGGCLSQIQKYEFQKEHPQYRTHHVQCVPENDRIVPNFLGGLLPRRDEGDLEYYYSTMLTLFKPWRSGKDLKIENQTWYQAFDLNKFTERQKEIMNNFHVRYECNDARDDHYNQRKCNKKNGMHAPFMSENESTEFDSNVVLRYDGEMNDAQDLENEEDIYNAIGSQYLKIQELKHEIQNVLQKTKWLDKSSHNVQPSESESINVPDSNQGSSYWNKMIKMLKEKIMTDRAKHSIPTSTDNDISDFNKYDEVVISDATYIDKNFKAKQELHQNYIDDTVKEFMLNKEQERAFRIVANHATGNKSAQLRMYLGGMGGTGKSQVIKALKSFFAKRNEAHRILILAPTGTAAALLNGSTYHSVLGIGSDPDGGFSNECMSLAKIANKLQGIDYIFIDEISMVACHELHKISAQLSKAKNSTTGVPFGGINMIFAGDFAQLPPVGGASLYSGAVGTKLNNAQTRFGQESCMGKVLWHQVTTVVILRQNMRQKTQSVQDANLRTALENMRYAACTQDDLNYLQSRIVGNGPSLSDKNIRNVSIITARNPQKDEINELGCKRFAKDTNQNLTTFYSMDSLPGSENRGKSLAKQTGASDSSIGPKIQDLLWNLPPSSTNHIPGKLSLCIGLPVMIRNNNATELCITKGQEGHVVGWQSTQNIYGNQALEVVYVKLHDPAKTIQLDGLPENVVPITRSSPRILQCNTSSGLKIKIKRAQVPVLPNFSMTDYSSQGKTRSFNVVDLSRCKSHQSYYTCLSRSASSEGTIILQNFNSQLITKGADGYLRQEFRELEILDQITEWKYHSIWPSELKGTTRNELLRHFQKYKGTAYVPKNVHSILKWSESDPMPQVQKVTDSKWKTLEKSKNSKQSLNLDKYITAKGTKALNIISYDPTQKFKKRKNTSDDQTENPVVKKQKLEVNISSTQNINSISHISLKRKSDCMDESPGGSSKRQNLGDQITKHGPTGFIWNAQDWSCAYDSLFTILIDLYLSDSRHWTSVFHSISPNLQMLSVNTLQVLNNNVSFETVRNNVRQQLHDKYGPDSFPYGQQGTDLFGLTRAFFRSINSKCTAQYSCQSCHTSSPAPNPPIIMQIDSNTTSLSINKWFENHQNHIVDKCPTCHSNRILTRHMSDSHNLFAFNIESAANIAISKSLTVVKPAGGTMRIPLKGVIYLGQYHFVCRIVDSNKEVWYNDGQVTGKISQYEDKLNVFTEKQLRTHVNHNGATKNAVFVIYARK